MSESGGLVSAKVKVTGAPLEEVALPEGVVDCANAGPTKVAITMHVNEQALANRYIDDAVKSKTDGPAADGDAGTTTEASTDGGK